MKILWTDGSAEPNPGKGGFAVLEQVEGKVVPVVLGHENPSTNIRMEGSAIIAAIKYAGVEGCEIHTDSQFWVNVLTKWAPSWARRGWRKQGGEIKNLEMVKEAYKLYNERPVKLVWVRGHVNIAFNEAADMWAGKARKGATIDNDN